MNERVMQFRIGMFVIVAGLVLTMMIVWFGESPSLFQHHDYVTVHYVEAPGVAKGIPVRRSGIRIGEVASIRFDERPKFEGTVSGLLGAYVVVEVDGQGKGLVPVEQFLGDEPVAGDRVAVLVNGKEPDSDMLALALPDGVLVTISLEKAKTLRAGATPKISRSLIGDVSIDMLPGTGPGPLPTSTDPGKAPIIEGAVAPDPANALAAATKAFEKVGGTLASIDRAANGIAKMTDQADEIGPAITSLRDMGQNVSALAKNLDAFVDANEGDFHPALVNVRQVSEKLNATLDEKTQANFRATVSQLAAGSARLDRILNDVEPLAKDLGAPTGSRPRTDLGQLAMRLNHVAYDVSLVTQAFRGPQNGQLNTNGTLQKLVTETELYDNLNQFAIGGKLVVTGLRPILSNFTKFSERIASDPSSISRGALQPR